MPVVVGGRVPAVADVAEVADASQAVLEAVTGGAVETVATIR